MITDALAQGGCGLGLLHGQRKSASTAGVWKPIVYLLAHVPAPSLSASSATRRPSARACSRSSAVTSPCAVAP